MELSEEHLAVLRVLSDCARALGPYRQDVVVTGGLVPLIYRFLPDFSVPRHPPMLTMDLDLTVPEVMPLRGEKRLVDLLREGEFVVLEARGARADLPGKHYFQRRGQGTRRLAPIHGEFLTPLRGSRTDRQGMPKSPRTVQNGLNAEALRYLELLLWEPMTVGLDRIDGLRAEHGLEVLLPSPATYLLQKTLSSALRPRREKRDKDLAYLYDVAMLTHRRWSHLSAEIRRIRQMRGPWVEKAAEIFENAFLTDGSVGSDAVARIYGNGIVQSQTVTRVMRRFAAALDF